MVLNDESDTRLFAEKVAWILEGGATVALEGELGAGKTTFVRYLIGALGGKSSDVASPSYTLSHEYQIKDALLVEHWDLYRLREAPEELLEPPASSAIRIVEWPDRAPELLATAELVIALTVSGENSRTVRLQGALAHKLGNL